MNITAAEMTNAMLMLSVEYQIEGNEMVARNLVSAALSLPDESLVRLYKAIRNFDDGERE
jgi:hypothetical protein